MNVITITPAATLPVSLAATKLYMDLRHSEFDAILDESIRAAVSLVEQTLELAIMQRTLEARLDDWPASRVIELPHAPLVSVSSVKYVVDGVEQTIAASNYTTVIQDRGRGFVASKFGYIWPSIDNEPEVIRIRYVVGLASDPANVPYDITQTIKEVAHRLFDTRGNINPSDVKRYAVQSLADYRVWRF